MSSTAGGPLEPGSGWDVRTSMAALCVTCGTTVEFEAPFPLLPGDLATDERCCVWCGEALLLGSAVDRRDRPARTAA